VPLKQSLNELGIVLVHAPNAVLLNKQQDLAEEIKPYDNMTQEEKLKGSVSQEKFIFRVFSGLISVGVYLASTLCPRRPAAEDVEAGSTSTSSTPTEDRSPCPTGPTSTSVQVKRKKNIFFEFGLFRGFFVSVVRLLQNQTQMESSSIKGSHFSLQIAPQ
jgi:hypothetical protein